MLGTRGVGDTYIVGYLNWRSEEALDTHIVGYFIDKITIGLSEPSVTKKVQKKIKITLGVARITLQNSSGKRLQQNQDNPIFPKVLATRSSQSSAVFKLKVTVTLFKI